MTVRMGPKGQVVIPKDVRDRLGLHPGDEVDVELADGRATVAPARRGGEAVGRGAFSGAGLLEDLARERRAERCR